MGTNKKNAKTKSSETIRDPHYTEFDVQQKRNVQQSDRLNKPSHP
jgi:hypothetical protein